MKIRCIFCENFEDYVDDKLNVKKFRYHKIYAFCEKCINCMNKSMKKNKLIKFNKNLQKLKKFDKSKNKNTYVKEHYEFINKFNVSIESLILYMRIYVDNINEFMLFHDLKYTLYNQNKNYYFQNSPKFKININILQNYISQYGFEENEDLILSDLEELGIESNKLLN